jgi:hypothetical protein
MPEVYECFFGLAQLAKLFVSEDKTFLKELKEFEDRTGKEMAQNRLKLYTDYGYTNEFQELY